VVAAKIVTVGSLRAVDDELEAVWVEYRDSK
jgi:hypothetical protein